MSASAAPPTVIFLHIPKTAGTTLRSILVRQYPPESYYHYYRERGDPAPLEAFDRRPPEAKAGIRVIAAHEPFGLHEQFPQRCVYLAAVREPVARVVSHYRYLRDEPNTRHYETVRSLSLEQFVDRLGMGGNLQTKLLAGVPGHELSDDPALLERAKDHLRRHFVTPIVAERFDESLMIVKDALGWRSVHYVALNTNRNRAGKPPLAAATRQWIERRNAMDLEIHAFANQLLDAAIAARMVPLEGELRHFRRVNRLYALPSQLKIAGRHQLKALLSGGRAVSPR